MKYFLGIDGGGSKTKVVIIDEHGRKVYEQTAGPSSIDTVDHDTTIKNIHEALRGFKEVSAAHPFQAVFVGLGGIVTKENENAVVSLVRQLPMIGDQSFVMARNDMYNALFSAERYDQGMTLICGTGMVAFGQAGVKTHKAGGWGFEEGELGSGYHLGREAMRHCVRALDKRHPYDDFAKAVAMQTGLLNTASIINVTRHYFGKRTMTASLAPLVTQFANHGNPYAQAICDQATDELAKAIESVYQELDFDTVTLVVVGSLGNADGYFKDQLHHKIKVINQDINIIAPLIDPAYAAAKAAKHFNEVKQ